MFLEKPAQIMAKVRERMNYEEISGRAARGRAGEQKFTREGMINIGGRPVVVPMPNPREKETSRRRTENIKLAMAFAAIYLIWGSTYLAIRYAVETIPPLVAVGIRHTIAGSILLGWAWARGFRPKREHWMAGFVVGALFFLVGHGSLHWAEQYVASGLAALLIATEPMFILLLAWMTGQQRISRISALGLGLGVAGVGILTAADFAAKGSTLMGVLAVLLGSFSWAAGVVVSPRVKLPSDLVARTAVPLVCGAILLWIAAAATGELQHTRWAEISLRSLGGTAYLVVFGSIIAFMSYTWLLQRCPPTLVATHTYANPIVAVLLGWLIASEALTFRVVLALAAILGAVVLIRRGERESARMKSKEEIRPAESKMQSQAIERVS